MFNPNLLVKGTRAIFGDGPEHDDAGPTHSGSRFAFGIGIVAVASGAAELATGTSGVLGDVLLIVGGLTSAAAGVYCEATMVPAREAQAVERLAAIEQRHDSEATQM